MHELWYNIENKLYYGHTMSRSVVGSSYQTNPSKSSNKFRPLCQMIVYRFGMQMMRDGTNGNVGTVSDECLSFWYANDDGGWLLIHKW